MRANSQKFSCQPLTNTIHIDVIRRFIYHSNLWSWEKFNKNRYKTSIQFLKLFRDAISAAEVK